MIQQAFAFGQFIILLLQIFPHAVKAWRAWEEYRGRKLTPKARDEIAARIGLRAEKVGKALAQPVE